jgi:hypothetical protein
MCLWRIPSCVEPHAGPASNAFPFVRALHVSSGQRVVATKRLPRNTFRPMFDSFFAAMLHSISAEVAQLVEQPIRNRQVPGSSPGLGSILKISMKSSNLACCCRKFEPAGLVVSFFKVRCTRS